MMAANQPNRTGGKGAGKGKGSSSSSVPSRTAWCDLQIRPCGLFTDAHGAALGVISGSQVKAKACGVYSAAGKDIEQYLEITSGSPLGMVTPNTDQIRRRVSDLSLTVLEKQIALLDPLSQTTALRQVLVVELGPTIVLRLMWLRVPCRNSSRLRWTSSYLSWRRTFSLS